MTTVHVHLDRLSLEHAKFAADAHPKPHKHHWAFAFAHPFLLQSPQSTPSGRRPPLLHSCPGTMSMLLSRRFSCALARAPSLVRGRPLPPCAARTTPPAPSSPPRRLMSSSSAGWQHSSHRPPPPPPPPPHPGADKVLGHMVILLTILPLGWPKAECLNRYLNFLFIFKYRQRLLCKQSLAAKKLPDPAKDVTVVC